MSQFPSSSVSQNRGDRLSLGGQFTPVTVGL